MQTMTTTTQTTNSINKKNNNKALLEAAANGDLKEVERLVNECDADVNTEGICNSTPLYNACSNDHLAPVKFLIKAGAKLNKKCSLDETALQRACTKNHLEIVKTLIKSGADVNMEDYGQNTPLHEACFEGHLEIIKILINAGANLKKINCHGQTPLDELDVLLTQGKEALAQSIIPFKKNAVKTTSNLQIVTTLVLALLEETPTTNTPQHYLLLVPFFKAAINTWKENKIHTRSIMALPAKSCWNNLELENLDKLVLAKDTLYFYNNLEQVAKSLKKQGVNKCFNDLKLVFKN